MDRWSAKEAETRFGEMLERCLADGPQIVTRDGTEAAVLVPMREWTQPAAAADGRHPGLPLDSWLMTDHTRGNVPVSERHHPRPRSGPTRKEVLLADYARGDIPMPKMKGPPPRSIKFED